jgi:hypothetical protein
MKTMIGMAALASALALSTAAFAQGNSTAGIDRYNNNPGRQQAQSHVAPGCNSDVAGTFGATGAGAGAFGFFGKDNNLAGGADGQQTGINNSAQCGNKDGAKVTGPN